MREHIIDELRPEDPQIDPVWRAETVRAILDRDTSDSGMHARRTRRALARVAAVAAAVAVMIGGVVVARDRLPADDVRPAAPISTTKFQRLDPSTARTLDLDVVADLPATYEGDRVLFHDFAGERAVVGSVIPEPPEGAETAGMPILAQSLPVIYDLDSERFTVLDDSERPEVTQIATMTGDESTVVWVEVIGTTIDHSVFTIYSYNRRTQQTRALAEFDDPDGQIVYGNDLVMAGDTAYFSTPTYPKKRGQEAVYSVPVDGSTQPTELASGAAKVQIAGDTLTYVVADPNDDMAYPTYVRYDLRSGRTTSVPVSSHVDEQGFCGAEFSATYETWCVGREFADERATPALLTIEETSGRTTEFAPFPIDPDNVPAPHGIMTLGPWTRILVTTEDGQERAYLADLDAGDIAVFPDNTSFGALSRDQSTVLVSLRRGSSSWRQQVVRMPGTD